jgi:hypothetical protein
VEQLDRLQFLVTITDDELTETGHISRRKAGGIEHTVWLLRDVKYRRRNAARKVILEQTELGEWIGELPKRSKVLHAKVTRDWVDSVGDWRVGFRIKFLDAGYATMFKLRFG